MRVPVVLAVSGLVSALLVAGPLAPACAADVTVRSFAGPTPVISIRGEIEPGDELKFTRFSAILATAIVELDSTGGRLAPSLTIGDLLARKGFSTYVGPHAVCSSACGLIWLAGKPRVKHATADVGFHAAYVADGAGVNRENGLSNALIGAYMTRLDLATEAVMFATAAAPDRMAWITPQLGARYGIAFEVVDDDLASLKTAVAPTPDHTPTGSIGPAQRDGSRPRPSPQGAIARQPAAGRE